VKVPRLRGEPLTLKIPEFTQSGQVFRVKSHGMSALAASRQQGDLYATISIRLPDRLTVQQRQLYEALAAIDNESEEPASGDK
jgi:molecular chaperone DnaJ